MQIKNIILSTIFISFILVLLPASIFGNTTTGNDGYGYFTFESLDQVELEKININYYQNDNTLDTNYTGELIAFKVGTMTIDYTSYSKTIKKATIKLTDYQNYVATIETSSNHKSTMALIARVNITNNRNSHLAFNEWYVIDDQNPGTNGNYVNIGEYRYPEEATIDFFFIVVNPDSLEENKYLTVNVTHRYNNETSSGYNPAIFTEYRIRRKTYSKYMDDRTIDSSTTALTIVKEFVTHYVEEDSQANIQIVKLFNDDDTFFNGKPHDYYKVIIDSTINSGPTMNKFEIGLQIVSENNFKLYLEENGNLNSSKYIPYNLYIKYKDGSNRILVNNSDKYVIKNINSTYNESNKIFYLTTKSTVQNPLTTEEGYYKDYLYLHFITEDYGADLGTVIDLG